MPAWRTLPEAVRPRMTGVALFDKSAIQALSRDEMEALSRADIYQNVPPVLLREVLGNVVKEYADRRDAGRMVQSLAQKIGGFHSAINVDYQQICTAELLGLNTVPLDRCAIVPMGASLHRLRDREAGMLIDQTDLSAMIYAWKQARFTEKEMVWAKEWRSAAYSFRKGMLTERLDAHRVLLPKPTDVADCTRVVKDLLARSALQTVWLEYLVAELNLPRDAAETVRLRWARGPGFLEYFAPYAAHCMRVILTVTIAARHRLIRWEPTTVVDAAYLYYIPFCEFFVSGDHVHERLAPELLCEPQRFFSVRTLKPWFALWRRRCGPTERIGHHERENVT